MEPVSPVALAVTDEDIGLCRETMLALRDHIPPGDYHTRVKRMMEQGYHLAYIRAGDRAVCVAGFRFEEMLARGRSMYIDDLVTHPRFRSGGHGGRMTDWLLNHAREHGCREVHLDSGVQRSDAHRFYLNKGFRITGYHFAIRLPGS